MIWVIWTKASNLEAWLPSNLGKIEAPHSLAALNKLLNHIKAVDNNHASMVKDNTVYRYEDHRRLYQVLPEHMIHPDVNDSETDLKLTISSRRINPEINNQPDTPL